MHDVSVRGLTLPALGLGTWRMRDDECRRAVEGALERGYRAIDTAEMYGNEAAIGAALRASGVRREDIRLTSKVWHEHLDPDVLRRAFSASLTALGTDYLDLYLIHWPSPRMDLPRTLEALTRLKEDGRARAIGVANFPVALMRQAIEEVRAPIACNQVEYHVLLDQSKVLAYARAHGLIVTAYCPLAQGRLVEHPALAAIARKHGATPAQVALKWLLDQEGVVAIPKAARAESQQANLDAFNVTLDDADRAAIADLPKTQRFVSPGWAPKWD
jgi:2,5-diketo-D-gluconate reductase B